MTDNEVPDVPDDTELNEVRAPWHFKLMVGLMVIYLGWRLVQGIMWVIDRLS